MVLKLVQWSKGKMKLVQDKFCVQSCAQHGPFCQIFTKVFCKVGPVLGAGYNCDDNNNVLFPLHCQSEHGRSKQDYNENILFYFRGKHCGKNTESRSWGASEHVEIQQKLSDKRENTQRPRRERESDISLNLIKFLLLICG